MNYRAIISLLLAASVFTGVSAQDQEVRIFSHRGGRMEHDENTMQAFRASYEAGYRGFETDVRKTKDGHMVITHDSNLERTTNGTGAVEEKTLAELMALDTKKGNKMLTLEQLVEFLNDKEGLYVEFEMKTNPDALYPEESLPAYVDQLYNTVTASQPKDALFVFTSSDTRALRCMQQRHPDAQLLLIVSEPVNDSTIARARALGIPRLGAKMGGTSRDAVARAHGEGLVVSLWPGQSVNDAVLGTYLGADYLCTDVPVAVKTWLKENAPQIKAKY